MELLLELLFGLAMIMVVLMMLRRQVQQESKNELAPAPAPAHDPAHAPPLARTGTNIGATVQHILDKGQGYWSRDEVSDALQAANYDTKQALESLRSLPAAPPSAPPATPPATTLFVKFGCSMCEKTLDSYDHIKEHAESVHRRKVERLFSCPICFRPYPNKAALAEHASNFDHRRERKGLPQDKSRSY